MNCEGCIYLKNATLEPRSKRIIITCTQHNYELLNWGCTRKINILGDPKK